MARKFESSLGLEPTHWAGLINKLFFGSVKQATMDYHGQNHLLEDLLSEIRKLVIIGAPRPFYPQKEAQMILGMSRTKVHSLVREGRLEVKHVDKKVYYTHRSIMKLVMGSNYTDSYTPA